jgi:hypothetical protein
MATRICQNNRAILRAYDTHYNIKTWPSNRRIARGGVSDLLTITIPLRTAARRTRFKANETHCPASAVVTVALWSVKFQTKKGSVNDRTACAACF